MKKLCALALFAMLFKIQYGQDVPPEVPEAMRHYYAMKAMSDSELIEIDTLPYDSTKNYLGSSVHKYKGQEFYLCGLPVVNRPYGYEGFVIKIKTGAGDSAQVANTYHGDRVHSFTPYDSIAHKYFKVLDVLVYPGASANPKAYADLRYLKLQEKNSKGILYYLYNCNDESKFPFVVKGYWDKAKAAAVGQTFVFPKRTLAGCKELDSSKAITVVTGDKWTCIDVQPSQTAPQLMMVIQNTGGKKTIIGYNAVMGQHPLGFVFTQREAAKYSDAWGEDKFNGILQGKVAVGMNADMCRIAWGEPDKIDRTANSPTDITQIWTYNNGHTLKLYNELVTEVH